MAHVLFNLSGPSGPGAPTLREQAAARLRVRMWGVDRDEPHRDQFGPSDQALVYVAEPERAFVGRAVLDSSVRDWSTSEADAYPGDAPGGVLLTAVEEWDPPLPMDAVLPRIDPDGSNPYVQANARDGFRTGLVRISAAEFETVLAVRAEHQRT